MAIYHLSVKTIGRSAGRSATAAAAYRSGEEISDERTGEVHDYTRRGGVAGSFLVVPDDAPAWAGNRATLWNQAEAAERRKNSTVAREIVLALPAELDAYERRELVGEFARGLADRHGVAVDVALHTPGHEGDHRNHHAHLLLSTRVLGPAGFGAKTRELDDRTSGPEAIRAWRADWARVANKHLKAALVEARIDHRSLVEQGVERAPTQHLGPAATAMQRSDERADSTRAAEALEADAAAVPDDATVGVAKAEILDLTVLLEAGRAERAKVARAEAERREQAEQTRLDGLSVAELRGEARARQPVPLAEQVADDRRVFEATAFSHGLAKQVEEFEQVNDEIRLCLAEWRDAHPVLARVHNSGRVPWRSGFVVTNARALAGNTAELQGLRERHGIATDTLQTALLEAIEQLRPEHDRRSAEADRFSALADAREHAKTEGARQARVAQRYRSASRQLGRMVEVRIQQAAGQSTSANFQASPDAWALASQAAAMEPEQRAQALEHLANPPDEHWRQQAEGTARLMDTVRALQEPYRAPEQENDLSLGL